MNGTSLRVLFAGTPEPALATLSRIIDGPHTVCGVLTRPPARAGRGRRPVASPVAELAARSGIEVHAPQRPGEADFVRILDELAPDVCVVVAYGALLPRRLLDIPRLGWVNLHFSLLPAWRGAAPVQHALLAGDDVTGATVFRLVEELDAGPVLAVMTETVRPRDTAGDLLARLASGGAGLVAATLDALADGALEARPQPHDGISLAPKITVDDARIRWTEPATAIDRRVRACTPAPGAWTLHEGRRFKILQVLPTDLAPLPAGRWSIDKSSVHVGTGTTPVRLLRVQPAGKRPMPAEDWARGLRQPTGGGFPPDSR